MSATSLATKYAKALYGAAADSGQQDKVFDELREFKTIIDKDPTIRDFFMSPVVKAEEREAALKAALTKANVSENTQAFLMVLAQKGRLGLFGEIVSAYQQQSDEVHGVVRGTVRSAAVLAPDQRKEIETIVGRVTKKQAILTYKEDVGVIGGLIAEVGSYTFDDTLSSHLRRIKEELNRREH